MKHPRPNVNALRPTPGPLNNRPEIVHYIRERHLLDHAYLSTIQTELAEDFGIQLATSSISLIARFHRYKNIPPSQELQKALDQLENN